MNMVLGKGKCLQALERTIKEFVEIKRVRFSIGPLKMKFEGFVESPRMLMREAPEAQVVRERDVQVAQYLMEKESPVLRDSYVSCLAMRDLEKLSGESRDEVERMIPDLESEKELAYLEQRSTDVKSLIKHKRLRDFLPKYAALEYFFTGMLVKNLLWNEKTVENKEEKTVESDFEIEYL